MKLLPILYHVFRQKCPRCGEGRMFEKWMLLVEKCSKCGCEIRSREDDTWFFMYITTAGMTGFFIIAMFLITPASLLLGRILVAVAALAFFIFTQPLRKSIAIGIEYYVDCRSEFPKHGKR